MKIYTDINWMRTKHLNRLNDVELNLKKSITKSHICKLNLFKMIYLIYSKFKNLFHNTESLQTISFLD